MQYAMILIIILNGREYKVLLIKSGDIMLH